MRGRRKRGLSKWWRSERRQKADEHPTDHGGRHGEAGLLSEHLDGENTRVSYSVKELFARIDAKLDTLGILIDAKADQKAFVDLEARVAGLETTNAVSAGLHRLAWAIAGLLVAIAGMLVPVVLSVT